MIKLSMGVRGPFVVLDWPAPVVFGTKGFFTDWKAQCSAALLRLSAAAVAFLFSFVRGSGAPVFTQVTKSATCGSVSLPLLGGGICSSSLEYRIASISLLPSG